MFQQIYLKIQDFFYSYKTGLFRSRNQFTRFNERLNKRLLSLRTITAQLNEPEYPELELAQTDDIGQSSRAKLVEAIQYYARKAEEEVERYISEGGFNTSTLWGWVKLIWYYDELVSCVSRVNNLLGSDILKLCSYTIFQCKENQKATLKDEIERIRKMYFQSFNWFLPREGDETQLNKNIF